MPVLDVFHEASVNLKYLHRVFIEDCAGEPQVGVFDLLGNKRPEIKIVFVPKTASRQRKNAKVQRSENCRSWGCRKSHKFKQAQRPLLPGNFDLRQVVLVSLNKSSPST
jgi:hypothetical protein